MEAKRDEGRASQRDYTPHEHEELRAIAERARQRLLAGMARQRLQLVTPPNWANESPPTLRLGTRRQP
jgi:hypothetical protein